MNAGNPAVKRAIYLNRVFIRAGGFQPIPPALELTQRQGGRTIMLDRRQKFRGRVYYGGLIAFNGRSSTIDCVVRNFSPFGAKVELENTALLPDEVDFVIRRRAFCCVARIVWRRANEAGLVFRNPRQLDTQVPLDVAIRLRASERAHKELRARIERLSSEH
jgi:PilZ domain